MNALLVGGHFPLRCGQPCASSTASLAEVRLAEEARPSRPARSHKADYDVAGAFDPSTALVPALERNISPNLLSPCGLGLAGRELGDLAMSIALTRSGFSIALSGFAVACCFLIGLQVSATTAAPSAGQTSLTINRTLKSDRMPLVPAITRNAVNGPVETNAPTATPGPKPLLLDGCEPMVSAIGQSPLAQIAGRCVS